MKVMNGVVVATVDDEGCFESVGLMVTVEWRSATGPCY